MVSRPGDGLVECVPNISEGRRTDVMDAVQAAVEAVRGVVVFDRHADAVHNRMVLTFAGPPGPVAEAAFRCVRRSSELIDLRQHTGVHPRMGATDVVPFVPLGTTPMRLCVDLARRVGRRVGAELDLPIYLYGEAAQQPDRTRLPDIRRGEYEGLQAQIGSNARLAPDFGPARVGPAGATAVGARQPLIAYNVTLASSDLALARQIARSIRESNGGLPAVQARGFPTADPEIVQVSINLLDYRQTPLRVVFERVREQAARHGVEVVASELVGMAPVEALVDIARSALRFGRLDASATIEARLLASSLGILRQEP